MHNDNQTLPENQVFSEMCMAVLACVVLGDFTVPRF